jgi:hypothetical protein
MLPIGEQRHDAEIYAMRHALRIGISLAAFSFLAFDAAGQVSTVSASRTVSAYSFLAGGEPNSRRFSTTEVGYWSRTASTSLARATHRSTIGSDYVEYYSMLTSGGGAGSTGDSASSLVWVFDISEEMRWDLEYTIDNYRLSQPRLTIDGQSDNIFADLDWNAGPEDPVIGSAYIPRGRYRFEADGSMFNAGFSTTETIRFNLVVPTPATLPVFGLALFATCRRR